MRDLLVCLGLAILGIGLVACGVSGYLRDRDDRELHQKNVAVHRAVKEVLMDMELRLQKLERGE